MVRLGEGSVDTMVRLGEGTLRLSEPLRPSEGRLYLGKPVTMLRYVFMACLGQFCGPIYDCYGLILGHCMTCLRVSLLD